MAQGNNPNNRESKLYRQFTKLFSGPLVNYRRQTYHKLRRRQLDRYKFTSASGQSFKKLDSNPFSQIMTNVMQNHQRAQRYADFDQMEYDPYVASALDMYSDDVTTSNPLSPMLRIDCNNDEIKSVLEALYIDVLNIESNLFQWVRTTCKYGDYFVYLEIDDERGITNTIGLPTSEVERLEAEDPTNPNYIQFQWNSGGMTFENWQVAHFRLLGGDKFAPYGQSVLDSARRIWRQLMLVEDAMMAYRLVRAPERRVFYIDVGSISPQDVEQYMEKIITSMKRGSIVNESTGRIDLRYNPLHVEEDYFLPVRGDTSKTRIEPLPGGQFVGDIDDVKYLRDKLFAAIKIPTSYLIREDGGGGEDQTTLAQKDIQFARTIQRIQRAIVEELEKIGIIHLFALGYRGSDLVNFKLFLNNPSKIAELQDLEHWRTKFDVAASAIDGFMSRRWISEKLFAQSHEEFLRNQREMFYDRFIDSNLEAAQESARAGAGDFFGEDALSAEFDEEMMPDMGEEEGAIEDEGPEGDESALLAAPAKRNDEYTKSGWKGKTYSRVNDDKRDMGQRRNNYNSQYKRQMGGGSARNIFKGMGKLNGLAKGIMEGNLLDEMYPENPEGGENGSNFDAQMNEIDKFCDMINEMVAKNGKEQLNG